MILIIENLDGANLMLKRHFPREPHGRERLESLLNRLRAAMPREQDESLVTILWNDILDSAEPEFRCLRTVQRLSKWCKTGRIYEKAMPIAREISFLLVGQILDRDRLGVPQKAAHRSKKTTNRNSSIESKRREIENYIQRHRDEGHPHYWCDGPEAECQECNMDHPMTELHISMLDEQRTLSEGLPQIHFTSLHS